MNKSQNRSVSPGTCVKPQEVAPRSALHWYRLILGLYFFFAVGYSVLWPLWDTVDERQHYLVVRSRALDQHMSPRNWEQRQPPLYYWLAGWPVKLVREIEVWSRHSLVGGYRLPKRAPWGSAPRVLWNAKNYKFELGPHLLRWINLLLGGLALHFIYKGVLRFVPEPTVIAPATMALVGLTPGFLHFNAIVSNDPLAHLAGAYLFWLLSSIGVERVGTGRTALMLVAGICLPVLVKLTVLPMALAVLLAAFWRLWCLKGRSALLVAGAVLATGLILAFSLVASEAAQPLWENALARALSTQGLNRGPRVEAWRAALGYWDIVRSQSSEFSKTLTWLLSGLLGVGWFASLRLLAQAPESHGIWRRGLVPVEQAMLVLFAAWLDLRIAVCMLLAWMWLGHQSSSRHVRAAPGGSRCWRVVWLVAALAFLAMVKNGLASGRYNGRYLFPSIGALGLLGTAGWSLLLGPHSARYLPHAVVCSMIGINLYVWFAQLIPLYYQPFLD